MCAATLVKDSGVSTYSGLNLINVGIFYELLESEDRKSLTWSDLRSSLVSGRVFLVTYTVCVRCYGKMFSLQYFSYFKRSQFHIP